MVMVGLHRTPNYNYYSCECRNADEKSLVEEEFKFPVCPPPPKKKRHTHTTTTTTTTGATTTFSCSELPGF